MKHPSTAAPRLTVETGRCLVRENPPVTALLKWQRAERGFRRATDPLIGRAALEINASSSLGGGALPLLYVHCMGRKISKVEFVDDATGEVIAEIDSAPTPAWGAEVNVNGKAYTVMSVVISYWEESPDYTHTIVRLDAHGLE